MLSVIKLISGTELVGTIIKDDGSYIRVENPLQIVYIQRSTGVPAISLQRYMPFTSQVALDFKLDHVESIGAPVQGLPKYYDEALDVIKTHIDPSLVSDLMDATERKKENQYDTYMAMLEKHMSKKPLN